MAVLFAEDDAPDDHLAMPAPGGRWLSIMRWDGKGDITDIGTEKGTSLILGT
jgi:hypothetical protein